METFQRMCVWHWSDTSTIVQQFQQPADFQDKADQLFWRGFLTSLMTSPKAQSPLKLSARTPKKTSFLRKSSECSFQLPTMSPVKVCLKMIYWIDWTTWLMIWIPLLHDQIIFQNILKELQEHHQNLSLGSWSSCHHEQYYSTSFIYGFLQLLQCSMFSLWPILTPSSE